MNNYNNKLSEIKKSRNKQVKKLTGLLAALVKAEWDMVSIANNKNDNISFLASKSLAEASKNVQLAISKLIITEFSTLEKSENIRSGKDTIRSLKKIIIEK
tara:strand:- start:364 stop:666 length:303 start_codon:yes stop_codon:yes gene_type:complete